MYLKKKKKWSQFIAWDIQKQNIDDEKKKNDSILTCFRLLKTYSTWFSIHILGNNTILFEKDLAKILLL